MEDCKSEGSKEASRVTRRVNELLNASSDSPSELIAERVE